MQALMAADWFHRLGYTLPYGTNIADFISDLASATIHSAKRCAFTVKRRVDGCIDHINMSTIVDVCRKPPLTCAHSSTETFCRTCFQPERL